MQTIITTRKIITACLLPAIWMLCTLSTAYAQPTIGVVVAQPVCNSATNNYTATGIVSLTNATAGSLTITDNGTVSSTVSVTAGQTTASFSVSGTSNASSHTVVANLGTATARATYAAPVSCTQPVSSPCSLTVTPAVGVCTALTSGSTVTSVFSSTVNVTFAANTPAGSLTISDGTSTTTVAVTANQTGARIIFIGLPANGATRLVSYDFSSGPTRCGVSSLTYAAPQFCTPQLPVIPVITLQKLVNKTKAMLGETISYSLVLTNTSSTSSGATATNFTVEDRLSVGANFLTGSASAPTGTTFTPGSPVSQWTIPSLAPQQSLTLTFAVTATQTGVIYNTATVGSQTATVCTSIPVQVCPGDAFEYEITAAAGRSSYRWYRTLGGVTTELTSATTNVLSVTAVGEYKLAVDNVEGKCPDFSCCPFIVEEVAPVASFSLTATPLSCLNNVAQLNGSVRVTGLVSSTASGLLTYELAQGGSDFESGLRLTTGKTALPAGGVLATNLAAGTYRVRVYNAAGCFRDAVVVITPVNCECPPAKCAPLVVQQTRKAPRLVTR